MKGAKKVYAIDHVPARLAMAKAAGANVEVIDFKAQNVIKTVLAAEPGGLDGESRSLKVPPNH